MNFKFEILPSNFLLRKLCASLWLNLAGLVDDDVIICVWIYTTPNGVLCHFFRLEPTKMTALTGLNSDWIIFGYKAESVISFLYKSSLSAPSERYFCSLVHQTRREKRPIGSAFIQIVWVWKWHYIYLIDNSFAFFKEK